MVNKKNPVSQERQTHSGILFSPYRHGRIIRNKPSNQKTEKIFRKSIYNVKVLRKGNQEINM